MSTKRKIHEVSSCTNCPFLSIEGMEHMLYCNHPIFDGKPYAGAIITNTSQHRIPDECPLKNGSIEVIKVVRLK